MAHAIGIDAGTTNVKVALVGPEGELVASAARALATRRSGDGEVAEQDAEALWRAVTEGIAEVAAAAAAQVVTIGCCSQYSSIVPVGADATPLADMVLWQDRRGAGYIQELLGGEGVLESWAERQGFPPVAGGCRSPTSSTSSTTGPTSTPPPPPTWSRWTTSAPASPAGSPPTSAPCS